MNLNQLSIIAISKLQSEIIDDLKGKNINNDITSNTLIDNKKTIKVAISNRESLTLCGEFFLKKFIKKKFPSLIYKSYFKYGDYLHKPTRRNWSFCSKKPTLNFSTQEKPLQV